MKQAILNEAGEPMGYEEVPTEQDRQEEQWDEMQDNSNEGVTCPKCKTKMFGEDSWDYGFSQGHEGYMCFKCNNKF